VAVQVLSLLGADQGQLRARVIHEIEEDPDNGGGSAPLRPQRAELPNAVQALLDTIDDRLTAIELHLGIAHPGPDAGAEAESGESSADPDGADAGTG